jgi:hypothetical protein
MKTYARVENQVVAEIITTTQTIGELFHPALRWVEVTGQSVQVGWIQNDNNTFAAPPQSATTAAATAGPSTAELQAEIKALKDQVAQLHVS